MNDIQVRCFLSAAKHENFTKAAESLFMAQPVLGRHISNLEDELGFQLFDRTRKTVRLTRNGKLFENFLQTVQQEYGKMMAEARGNLRSECMHLEIGSVDGQRAENYFTPVLRYIIGKKCPITVSVSYFRNADMVMEALKAGSVDVAVAEAEFIDEFAPVLVSKHIRTTKGCLIVPRRPNGSEYVPEEYATLPFILRSESDSKFSREAQMETARKIGATEFMTVPNLSTLEMMVKAGVGMTTVPENQELCFDPDVSCIAVPDSLEEEEVLVWRKGSSNPAITAFCEIMDLTGAYEKERELI